MPPVLSPTAYVTAAFQWLLMARRKKTRTLSRGGLASCTWLHLLPLYPLPVHTNHPSFPGLPRSRPALSYLRASATTASFIRNILPPERHTARVFTWNRLVTSSKVIFTEAFTGHSIWNTSPRFLFLTAANLSHTYYLLKWSFAIFGILVTACLFTLDCKMCIVFPPYVPTVSNSSWFLVDVQ